MEVVTSMRMELAGTRAVLGGASGRRTKARMSTAWKAREKRKDWPTDWKEEYGRGLSDGPADDSKSWPLGWRIPGPTPTGRSV
jgi:hypothetical protein